MADQKTATVSDIPTDELPQHTEGYKPPQQVAVAELLAKDANDESLAKYKASLIANANATPFPDDPRYVIVAKIIVQCDGKVQEFDPNKGKFSFQMPEKKPYDIKLQFYVQRDIVSCLKYINIVYNKLGIQLTKNQVNVGSFGPAEKTYDFVVESGETPGGMMGRGTYNAKARLIDDEQRVHLEAEYTFEIVKA